MCLYKLYLLHAALKNVYGAASNYLMNQCSVIFRKQRNSCAKCFTINTLEQFRRVMMRHSPSFLQRVTGLAPGTTQSESVGLP